MSGRITKRKKERKNIIETYEGNDSKKKERKKERKIIETNERKNNKKQERKKKRKKERK